jgi:hypothetical protein
MNSIRNFISKLSVGNSCNNNNDLTEPLTDNSITKQITHIKEVWNSNEYPDYGIERALRLFLVCVQIIFPGLYIRAIAKTRLDRKMLNEFYVNLKIFIYIIFLCVPLPQWISYICIYLIAETLCYLLGLIFLEPEYKNPAYSYKRNLILVIINYIEITLGFAVIYFHGFTIDAIPELKTSIDAIYFSFISTTTVGYGDMHPITNWSKITCATQSLISFLFVVFFISKFLSNFNKDNTPNDKSQKDNQSTQGN